MRAYQQHFNDLISANAYYRNLLTKLKKNELPILQQLIDELSTIANANEREKKINRLFIDASSKPKNHLIILDLLSGANSRAYKEQNASAKKANQGQHYA